MIGTVGVNLYLYSTSHHKVVAESLYRAILRGEMRQLSGGMLRNKRKKAEKAVNMARNTHKTGDSAVNMAQHNIKVVRERLSDGSFVYNVHVPALIVAAESEETAQRFADSLAVLHNDCNLRDEDLQVRFEY